MSVQFAVLIYMTSSQISISISISSLSDSIVGDSSGRTLTTPKKLAEDLKSRLDESGAQPSGIENLRHKSQAMENVAFQSKTMPAKDAINLETARVTEGQPGVPDSAWYNACEPTKVKELKK